MQISTLVRRFILIFLRYLSACELSYSDAWSRDYQSTKQLTVGHATTLNAIDW